MDHHSPNLSAKYTLHTNSQRTKINQKTIIYLLFLLLFSIIPIIGNSQGGYRIKPVETDNALFILPPHAKLAWEGLFNNNHKLRFRPKSRFRYHYIVIEGLRTNMTYQELSQIVNDGEYFYSGSGDALKDSGYHNLTQITTGPNEKAIVYMANGKSILALKIDYDVLMQNAILNNFNQLAIDILETINAKAEPNWVNGHGLAQLITEKAFNVLPHPLANDLSQFVFKTGEYSSFLLMSPKISLILENENLDMLSWTSISKWNYSFANQTQMSLYRGKDGYYKQSPFINFQSIKDEMSDNSFIDDGHVDHGKTLLASSADLQLSENTYRKGYIALYQNFTKRNNDRSSKGIDRQRITGDNNITAGNTRFLLSNDLKKLIDEPDSCDYAIYASSANVSHKYLRNLIQPMTNIFLNGHPFAVKLGSTVDILQQQLHFGGKFKMYRLYQDEYKEFNKSLISPYVLPGDKINF